MRRFRRISKFCLVAAIVCAGGGGLRAQAPEGPMVPQPDIKIQQSPTIKVQTVLVNTPVTVRNLKGEMVHNLEESDFKITDNGAPQKITHFSLGGDPISLVVVVETSSLIAPILPQIRKMGIMISQVVKGPTGEAAVVSFDDDVKVPLEFTGDSDELQQTMNRLPEGFSGARLYDAMAKGVDMLSQRPEASETELGHRRVMLLIAAAHDTGSEEQLGEVLRRAQHANVTIYALGISSAKADLLRKPPKNVPPPDLPPVAASGPPPPGTVATPTTQEQAAQSGGPLVAAVNLSIWAIKHAKDKVIAHQLEIAAAATGGQYVSTWKNHKIEQTLDEMGGELHAQYVISYAPSGQIADIDGYHQIEVKVDRSDLSVRARPGYYLAGPGE